MDVVVGEQVPLVDGLDTTEEDAPPGPFADLAAEGVDDSSPAQEASAAAPAFDIDDSGRRTTALALNDGTSITLIQDVYVDWRSGTSVGLVLKGFANRRFPSGQVPGNTYRLSLRHALSLQTRKLGRTVPPVDFLPLSNGQAGLYVVTGNYSVAVLSTEWGTVTTNSMTLHYWGAWQISAAGEPRDNPIDRIQSNLVLRWGNREYSTPAYAARRGGQ